MSSEDLATELEWRGAIFDATPDALGVLAKEKVVAYNGFDPSAASFHVGNLVPIMGLVRLQRHGHTPIAIVGGGTGMIGDPGGRSEERPLLSREQVEENVAGLRRQLESFLDFEVKTNPARLINNADWLLESRTIDFMRDVGKHFTVNYMLAKESVKGRMGGDGISFTEFGYMLLQAYDFQVLHDRYGCTFQVGGSDQWGNILAGVDLLRRTRSERVNALVYPLITLPSGEKMGKSAGGAAWLDPDLTSPYRLYQYLFNADDELVATYLKLYTLLERDAVAELEDALAGNPAERAAQRKLAREVVGMVHGETALANAERATAVLFGGEIEGLSASDLEEIFADVPSSESPKASLEGDGLPLARLMVDANLAASAGEARRLTEQGGVYVNNRRVDDARATVGLEQAVDGRVLILRRGARSYHLVRLV